MNSKRWLAALALAASCLTAGHAGAGERLVYTGALLFDDPYAPLSIDRPAVDVRTLADNVAADPLALGITSLASVRGRTVKILAVDVVDPSADSLAAGAYPLFQPLQIAVAGGDRLAERFVRFAQSSLARRILRRNGVVPYMDGLSLVRHQFDRENRLQNVVDRTPQ